MRLKISYLFFWTISIFGLYPVIDHLLKGDGIHYAFVAFGLNVAFVSFLIPILMHMKIIPENYYTAEKYQKAKTKVIFSSIFTPGFIVFGFFLSNPTAFKLYCIVLILLIIEFLTGFFTLLNKKKNESS